MTARLDTLIVKQRLACSYDQKFLDNFFIFIFAVLHLYSKVDLKQDVIEVKLSALIQGFNKSIAK